MIAEEGTGVEEASSSRAPGQENAEEICLNVMENLCRIER